MVVAIVGYKSVIIVVGFIMKSTMIIESINNFNLLRG